MPAEPARVEALFEAAVDALEHFSELCVKKESDNAQIAVKNGGVEVSLDAYQALKTYRLSWGSRALKILHALLQGNSNVSLFFLLFSFFLCCWLHVGHKHGDFLHCFKFPTHFCFENCGLLQFFCPQFEVALFLGFPCR